MNNKIYLAGPDVFRPDALDHFQRLKSICTQYGFIGVSPFDTDLPKGLDKSASSKLIFESNVQKIKDCNYIVANLIPFRGACIDDGTAWEIAYGYSLDKTIIGYTQLCNTSLKDITKEYYNSEGWREEFTEIEDFDNCCNLMIYESITKNGAIVKTFEDAIKALWVNKFNL